MNPNDGLLTFPYTKHDWALIGFALIMTIIRLIVRKRKSGNKLSKSMGVESALFVILIIMMLSFALYEYAIAKGWNFGTLCIVYIFIAPISTDIALWAMLKEDGRSFVIETFKLWVRDRLHLSNKENE